MIHKINKEQPFEYYSIKHTTSSKNDLVHRVAHRVQETFQNLFHHLCNGAIACANTLKLYKFQKVEETSFLPTGLQKTAFVTSAFSKMLGSFSAILILEITNLRQLRASLDSNWKKRLAIAGFLFKGLPIAGLGYQIWETYHIAGQSLNSLGLCWNDTKKPLKSRVMAALVHTGNLAQTISMLYGRIRFESFLYNYIPYMYESYKAYSETFPNLLDKCPKIPPNTHVLSDKQRILSTDLNPNCVAHAFEIIAPGKDYHDKAEVNGNYRKLQRTFHPDKCGDNDECLEISKRLGTAWNCIREYRRNLPK